LGAPHAAAPPGWYVGMSSYHGERDEWLMYAFDPAERAAEGIRRREWTAIAATEEALVAEMAEDRSGSFSRVRVSAAPAQMTTPSTIPAGSV
jgi:hypothetical protein